MGPLWFPKEEYEARFQSIRTRLEQRGLEALLLTWDTNLRYYTGYRQTTANLNLSRVTAALLPVSSDPVLFVHIFLSTDARASVWFDDVRTFRQLHAAPLEEIAGEISARGLRRIGAELGQEQRIGMPWADFETLRSKLSGVELVDASDLIWHQRTRKSPAEVECLRQAGQITARAYEIGFPEIHEGMTEREAAGILQRAMFEAGAEQVGFILLTSGEGRYGRISGLATDRRLERGDMLWVDMGARTNDYFADFSRAGVVGGPTDQQRRMQDLVIAATAKGVEQARPGVHVGEIVKACEAEMRRQGQDITFVAGRIGHGIGLNSTEHPHVAMYDPTILEPGMAITVEPGIVEQFGTFHVEENVIITESGNEVISTARRDLWRL